MSLIRRSERYCGIATSTLNIYRLIDVAVSKLTPISGNAASYSVEVKEGSENNTFTINSEIGTESTIAGIANIVN